MREHDEQLAAQAERYSQLGDEELQLLIDREQMGMEVAMNDYIESPSGVSTAGGSAPMWNTDPGLVDSASRLASHARSGTPYLSSALSLAAAACAATSVAIHRKPTEQSWSVSTKFREQWLRLAVVLSDNRHTSQA